MTILLKFFIFMKTFNKNQHILHYAAQMAYRFLLACTPLIMLLYHFFKWFSSDLSDEVLKGIYTVFPFFMNDFIDSAINLNISVIPSSWANTVFIFFLFYASVCAIRSVIVTFDKMLGTAKPFTPKNYLSVWGKAVICLFLTVPSVLFILAMYVFTQSISSIILEYYHLSSSPLDFWKGFSMIYILSIITLLSTAIYMFFPSAHQRFANALPGGITTGIGWLCLLMLYRFFIKSQTVSALNYINFLKGPFSLIIFAYIFCIILTFGNAVNIFFSTDKEIKDA